jgi:hypothetical protein
MWTIEIYDRKTSEHLGTLGSCETKEEAADWVRRHDYEHFKVGQYLSIGYRDE